MNIKSWPVIRIFFAMQSDLDHYKDKCSRLEDVIKAQQDELERYRKKVTILQSNNKDLAQALSKLQDT